MGCEVSLASEDSLETAAPATVPTAVTSRMVSNPQVIAPIAVPALVPKQELQSGSDASDKFKTIPAAVPPIVDEKPLAPTANQPPAESRTTPTTIETAATATPTAVVSERTYPVYPKFEQPITSYQEVAPAKTSGISSGLLTMYGVVLVLALLTNAGYAAYKHRHGTLTIYQDLTDATFTGLAPVISLIVYFALRFAEVNHGSAWVAALCVFIGLMWFVIKSTYRNNEFPLGFLMALIAKLTGVFAYYAYLLMLLGNRQIRQEGESKNAFNARATREFNKTILKAGAATAALMAWSKWVSRSNEFSSLMDYCYPTNSNIVKNVDAAETSDV